MDENDPRYHNCDAMGCGRDHVVYRAALAAERDAEEVVTHFVIPASPGLDPIRVFAVDHEPCKGTLIVQCYNEAWACYFGAMDGRSLLAFIASVDRFYLGGALGRGNSMYRERIANALILAARERVKPSALAAERGREG